MSGNAVAQPRQNRAHLVQSFPHPIPFNLKSISVVNDMTKTTERPKLPFQVRVEERGQWRLSRPAEALKQVKMPVFSDGHHNAMKSA